MHLLRKALSEEEIGWNLELWFLQEDCGWRSIRCLVGYYQCLRRTPNHPW